MVGEMRGDNLVVELLGVRELPGDEAFAPARYPRGLMLPHVSDVSHRGRCHRRIGERLTSVDRPPDLSPGSPAESFPEALPISAASEEGFVYTGHRSPGSWPRSRLCSLGRTTRGVSELVHDRSVPCTNLRREGLAVSAPQSISGHKLPVPLKVPCVSSMNGQKSCTVRHPG